MRIAALAFPGMSAFHLSVPALIFGEDRRAMGLPQFDYQVVAEIPGSIALSGGMSTVAVAGPEALATADIAIVPSWRQLDDPVPGSIAEALRAAAEGGGRVAGLCLGAYALAGAGLLDGRGATTHWGWADHFAARFPSVRLDASALYVEDGPCVTSAGVAASLDCCLHIVRRISGEAVATALARRIVMAPHRAGGQAQFIDQPILRSDRDNRLGRALEAIATALGEDWPLDRAAEMTGMTRRSFTRQLRSRTGAAFGDWLTERRIASARNLLERTDLSIDRIAEATGLGTSANLRIQFTRRVGLAPSRWRAQFASPPAG